MAPDDRNMNRRNFLAGVGCGVSITHAGCLADNRPTDGSSDENRDDNESRVSNETEDNSTTVIENEKAVEEDSRVTEPPYEIEQPDTPDNPEEGDEWNDEYLGEHMKTEPSLAFETLSVPVDRVRDTGLGGGDGPDDEAYEVRVVEDTDDYEAIFRRDSLNAIDFDEYLLILVESGIGSGSVEHRWARVEADGGIVHLYGYYTDPYEQTDDLDTRFSVLKVERPSDDVEFARVSLTVEEERRIHVNSTEGVVTLEE